MTDCVKTYLATVAGAFKAGTATEHTYRPALKTLLEALEAGITATNEPRRIACGAPDYSVTRGEVIIGYVEAKDIGKALGEVERSEQMQRYRRALRNLLLTDYLEFRWYVNGELRQTARLAQVQATGQLKADKAGSAAVTELLRAFLTQSPQGVDTPLALAEQMARLTHLIREIIVAAFATGSASALLTGWRKAFAEVLLAGLDKPENAGQFADMFAQTLAYGLFSARVMSGARVFTRATAQGLIPRTNPFLRRFFYEITGPDLDDEPYAGFVDDLVQLLARADMDAILADFGKRTRQDDPTVHFYETFLAAYDPALREQRGVYYTPTPVVAFIARAVDALLKSRFGLPAGLADTHTLAVDGQTLPKVLILDPATGTGTFLYTVIDLIRQQFMQQNNAGAWSSFVRQHLLPRIFGFELLMAPYAVAHFKLAYQLAGHDLPPEQRATWAYDFASDERLQVYLTNTLEMLDKPGEGLWGPLRIVTEEAQQANRVKRELPIMVVLGNPPYAVSSSNKGPHIEALMARYKAAVRSERNIQPLSDDYIKFIRFAHDRIERTGAGIVGFITNHSYLSGLIHRGMREELFKSFDEIYILNLHGNALMGETAPDGGKDENVFDIRQGVAIALLVKTGTGEGRATVYYADLWGERESKYRVLSENDVTTLSWETLRPAAPNFFFVPKNFGLQEEYEGGWSTIDIFRGYSTGFETGRDVELIAFSQERIRDLFAGLADSRLSNENITTKYGLNDTSGWPVFRRRANVIAEGFKPELLRLISYRPFDRRYTYYHDFLRRAQFANLRHLCQPNYALITARIIKGEIPKHVCISTDPVEKIFLSPKTSNNAYIFPLYLYPAATATLLDATALAPWPPDPARGNRVPNLAPEFVKAAEAALGLPFTHIQPGADGGQPAPQSQPAAFGPEDLLAYLYAILHSPTYRARYAEFLKIDFPRVPLTRDVALFWQLVALGRELLALHLLDFPPAAGVAYPIPGDNRVEKGYPRYTPAPEGGGRVHINPTQYFAGIPEAVWEFQIGGYQVLHKWLKDRQGRVLVYDDLAHYQHIVAALQDTLRLMAAIDAAIPSWPL